MSAAPMRFHGAGIKIPARLGPRIHRLITFEVRLPMKLLALDTATDACSASVYLDGNVHDCYELAPRRHAQRLLSMIQTVMGEAGIGLHDLSAVAFGRGPGSFTGVRIAASTAQAIGLGAGLPVVAVSSLQTLAQTAFRLHGATKCAAAFDARMDEVYYGAFRVDTDGFAQPVVAERLCRPEDVPPLDNTAWRGAGTGWEVYEARLRMRLGDRVTEVLAGVYPQAHDVAVLGVKAYERGEASSAEAALPVYLRDRVTRA